MASLGIGDGLAPLIGKYYGRMRYRFPLSTTKSIEGSFFGVFLGSIGGAYFFLYIMGKEILSYESLISVGAIATVAEATSPGSFDNIFLPLVMHFSLSRLPSLKL